MAPTAVAPRSFVATAIIFAASSALVAASGSGTGTGASAGAGAIAGAGGASSHGDQAWAPRARAAPRAAAAANYTLNVLPAADFPLATCLVPSSQGAYYYRPAQTPQGATKLRIFFDGGGWCVSDEDCFGRTLTPLGNNSLLPQTDPDPAGYCGDAFLSGQASDNPSIWDWAAVYVPYCDGGSFTGRRMEPVVINATATVAYRGSFIRDALVAHLASAHGLAAATDVIVGGCSAGGLAVYLGLDTVAAQIRQHAPTARVTGIADAGFFLDHLDSAGRPAWSPIWQWGFYAWASAAGVNQRCVAALGDEPWRCIFAQNSLTYIETPLFVLNSKYDSWQMAFELGLKGSFSAWNASERASAIQYSHDFAATLTATGALWSSSPRHGGFITACQSHCDAGTGAWTSTYLPPAPGGAGPALTPSLAFAAWLSGNVSTPWWFALDDIPDVNPTCQ